MAAAGQDGASSAVTGGDVALPAVASAALGESAAWSVGPLEQHPAHAQPQLPPQQPLGRFNTGLPPLSLPVHCHSCQSSAATLPALPALVLLDNLCAAHPQ